MSFIAVGVTGALTTGSAIAGSAILGAGTALYGANANKKAAQGLLNNTKTVDINAAIEQARTQAEANIKDSIALENKYDPTTAALRKASDANLAGLAAGEDPNTARRNKILAKLFGAAGGDGMTAGRDSIINGLIGTVSDVNPTAGALTKEGAQSVLADLRLGGALDAETQAEVMRSSLETGAGSGIIGSLAGRGLAAADIGLTSMQLKQMRQDRANSLAMGLNNQAAGVAGLADNAAGSNFDRLGFTAQALDGAAGNDYSRKLGIASLLENRARPVSGLDPSSVVDLTIGNTNTQNQAAANAAAIRAGGTNATLGLIGQGLGAAATLYAGRKG